MDLQLSRRRTLCHALLDSWWLDQYCQDGESPSDASQDSQVPITEQDVSLAEDLQSQDLWRQCIKTYTILINVLMDALSVTTVLTKKLEDLWHEIIIDTMIFLFFFHLPQNCLECIQLDTLSTSENRLERAANSSILKPVNDKYIVMYVSKNLWKYLNYLNVSTKLIQAD